MEKESTDDNYLKYQLALADLSREEKKNITATFLINQAEEDNEKLEDEIDELKLKLESMKNECGKYGGDIKKMIEDELTRLQELQFANEYKFDPNKLKVQVIPPRTKAPVDPETIEFRLLHPELIDFSLVGIDADGCDGQIYQQLQYPEFFNNKTTQEFNLELNNSIFQTPVIPDPNNPNNLLSVYQYKELLDEKIKQGNSMCGIEKPISARCEVKDELKAPSVYNFFSVPQMSLPLRFNPYTIDDPVNYPGMLLYHQVGSGKTCTALKIFNNFRCNPYKKIWVTNKNLASQLLSGAVGKNDVFNCWDGEDKVFVDKDYVSRRELGVDQILVLTYDKFAEVFYRSSTVQEKLYQKRYPAFWTRPGDKEPLDASTYRYHINHRTRSGKRTQKWSDLKGTDNDFDPLENTIIVIDEADQLATVKGPQMQVFKNAIRDSQQNPSGKGTKLVLMTATPITEDPMTAIMLLNLIIPYSYGLRYKVKKNIDVAETKPQKIKELTKEEKEYIKREWKNKRQHQDEEIDVEEIIEEMEEERSGIVDEKQIEDKLKEARIILESNPINFFKWADDFQDSEPHVFDEFSDRKNVLNKLGKIIAAYNFDDDDKEDKFYTKLYNDWTQLYNVAIKEFKKTQKGGGDDYEELSGLPVDEKTFREMYWNDIDGREKFINIIKGLVSYYDPSHNYTSFAKKIPGELLIPKENKFKLGYHKERDNFGIIKVLLGEEDRKQIEKICFQSGINFELLETANNIPELFDLLSNMKDNGGKKIRNHEGKTLQESIKRSFGVAMSSNIDDFIKKAFTSKYIRDPKEMVNSVIRRLKAIPYLCTQDIIATGEPSKVKRKKLLKKDKFNSDSTKVKVLANQISNIDQNDINEVGHLNKHMIFSSMRIHAGTQYSAVPIRIYESLLSQNTIKFNNIENLDKLLERANLTFRYDAIKDEYTICPLYSENRVLLPDPSVNNIFFLKNAGNENNETPEQKRYKKKIEAIWNDHIYNNKGQLLRFIVLDTGYKAGISLFNIRHVHIMEPQPSSGDLTQAVGRAIRFCGHKGTEYEPGVGWKVFVYVYDSWIPLGKGEGYMLGDKLVEIMGASTDFISELEETLKTSAFDYTLNLPLDSLELMNVDPQTKLLGSLWERPPAQFDYEQFEKKYFYKMFPKIRAIPEEEIIENVINPLVKKYKDESWWNWGLNKIVGSDPNKIEDEELEKKYKEWIKEEYFVKYFENSEELLNTFKANYMSSDTEFGVPHSLKKMFRDFNYQKDIALHTMYKDEPYKVIFPVFAFKERTKIDYEKAPELSEIRAMVEYDNYYKTLNVYFRDISNGSICDITAKDINDDKELYNLSLWLRIPNENINFSRDISHFVGDCQKKTEEEIKITEEKITLPPKEKEELEQTIIPPIEKDEDETSEVIPKKETSYEQYHEVMEEEDLEGESEEDDIEEKLEEEKMRKDEISKEEMEEESEEYEPRQGVWGTFMSDLGKVAGIFSPGTEGDSSKKEDSRTMITSVDNVDITQLPQETQDLLNSEVNGWVIDKDSVFSTADITLVAPAYNADKDKEGIFKASYLDQGRLMNEYNMIREFISRGKKLGISTKGFPTIIDKGQVKLTLNGKERTVAYYVMEYIGPSLYDIAVSSDSFEKTEMRVPVFGGISIGQAALIAQRIIETLSIMHTPEGSLGMLHNDIKPGNVLVDKEGVYLIDYDVISALGSSPPSDKKQTPQIMVASAEFAGTDPLLRYHASPKSDLDSLGQLMVWLVNGELPWVNNRRNLKALANEKQEWRLEPYSERSGLGPLSNNRAFEEYFTYVENLKNSDRNIDYKYLSGLFDDIADDQITIV